MKTRNKDSQREQHILKTGKSLFGSLKGSRKNLFSKKWWYGQLMQWTLVRSDFKTSLFRFVDVFPCLKKEDIAFFLNEYLTPKALPLSKKLLPPSLLSAFISKQMEEMASLFIAGKDLPSLLPVLQQIRKSQNAFTLDLLGEAVLSEKESQVYLHRYLQMIENLRLPAKDWKHNPLTDEDENKGEIPKVNISVKLSSLDSQILTCAWEESKNRLKNKVRILFQKAIETNTFIYIDMEQYKYKTLTLEVFKELISEKEFKNYPHFGIVIQSYLRESLDDLQGLFLLARERLVPFHIRLVKGAYWDYEWIHSEQFNWPCPVYMNKWESDHSFEVCAEQILKHYPSVRLAVGTHNIRSLTYAISLLEEFKIPKKALEIQTLYGMAEGIQNQLIQKGWRVRQYCPIGTPIPGMAYLVRRLLENTANESFIKSWQNTNTPIEDLLVGK